MTGKKVDKGLIAAILAPVFIGISIILANVAGRLMPPLLLAAYAALISVVFLAVIALVLKEKTRFKSILTKYRRDFIATMVSRSVFGAALLMTGFSLTSAFNSVILLRLEPVLVFIWSMLLLKEKATTSKIILLLCLIIGGALVVSENGFAISAATIGDLLIILALVFLSFSYIPSSKIIEKESPLGLTILANGFGGILLLIIAALLVAPTAFIVSNEALPLLLAYTLMFPVIASALYFYAFKTLKPWVVASFLSLEAIVGVALAIFLLQEMPSLLQGIGAVIMIASTYLIAKQRAKGGK